MKLQKSIFSFCLFIGFTITGCQTDESGSAGSSTVGMTGNVKTQGVYTTLAMPDVDLDMPASGYSQKTLSGRVRFRQQSLPVTALTISSSK